MQLLIHLQHRFSLSRLPTPLMWSWSRGELLRSLLPRMGAEFSPPPGSPQPFSRAAGTCWGEKFPRSTRWHSPTSNRAEPSRANPVG